MSQNLSQSLWPPDFGEVKEKTPVAILREQGQALGEKTANIVFGRVETQPGGTHKLRHIFDLICNPLSFRLTLLYVDHDLGLYPADIFVDGDGKPPIRVVNSDEFVTQLKEIFAREKTKKTIASLIAQSKD